MIENEALNLVMKELLWRNLGQAIVAMDNFLVTHPQQHQSDRLLSIRSDYQLMTDYWRRGFKDNQLPELYNNMLRRMYVLYGDMAVDEMVSHSHYLNDIRLRVNSSGHDWSPQRIREMLENYVSDMAMLALEPAHTATAKRETLCSNHQHLMTALFGYVLTSGMWTEGFGHSMEEILLSPTVDSNDQQLLTSGITLSSVAYFDMVKFRLLVKVYQQSEDEHVRQRALVGWVFSLDASIGKQLYPEENQLVEKLLEDDQCCQELTELQKQIIYCLNAEKDHATIQEEIMPDLLKNQGFKITRNGIEEGEEDPLHDILYSDEEEKNLEKVEASFQRMIDMQKQGSDIYFGGFSRMKGFHFFNEISNWFMPFDMNHPEVCHVMKSVGNNRFLKSILSKGPFCNSDKYSFLLAFNQVILHIPQDMREMLERGEAAIQEIEMTEQQTPAYIRRIYLQDLYRFFRLCSRRNEFRNVLEQESGDYLFFGNPIFSSTHLELRFNEVTSFLMKKERLEDAANMLINYGVYRKDFQYYMMAGYLAHYGFEVPDEAGNRDTPLDAKTCYEHALQLKPDNERALAGYARALFDSQRYQEALDTYERLLLIHEKKRYLLNKSVCLTKLERYADAEQVLYRLNYDNPDDRSVNRVLAWALTCDGKYGQAVNLYGQLLSAEKPLPDDLLNYGYCLWFDGKIDEAADCFHRYLVETKEPSSFIITNEHELIARNGISEPEMQMMQNIL